MPTVETHKRNLIGEYMSNYNKYPMSDYNKARIEALEAEIERLNIEIINLQIKLKLKDK